MRNPTWRRDWIVTGRQLEYDYKTDTFVVTGDAVVNQAATSGGCAH